MAKRKLIRDIPRILFTGAVLILVFLWANSLLNFRAGLEYLFSTSEFDVQKAFASEKDIEEALDVIHLFDDTMYVESDSAFPDSVAWIYIGIKNTGTTVAGFSFAITYDTSVIAPYYVLDVDTSETEVIDTTVDPPETTTVVLIDTGYVIDARRTPRTEDLNFLYFSGGVYNKHLDTTRFIAGIYPDPLNPILDVGSEAVVKIKFIVKPTAPAETSIPISFAEYIAETDLPNTWDDSLFENIYVPRTKQGTFTVRGGGPPPNQCPVFGSMPSSFEVNEGASLQFDVAATDPDGDSLTLYMDPIDPDYNYSFPTIKDEGSVAQTFSFNPTFTQGPATIYVTFKAEDERGCVTEKVVSIQIIETAQDLLIASSEQGGVPGSAERMVPFVITNSIPIYGFQFTLRWDYTVVDVDSFARTDVTQEFSVYTNLGDSLDVATVLVFGLAGETIPAGVETVLYAALSVDENATPGEVSLQLENAREAINPGDPSYPLGVVHGKFTIDLFGDANIDILVDIADVVSVVGYILGDIEFSSREFLAADVTDNDTVNVADLVGIINIILGRWVGPSPSPYSDSEPEAIVRLDYEDLLPGTEGEVKVLAELEVPVAGAQLRINYDPEQLSFDAPQLSDWSSQFIAEYEDNKQGELIVLLYNWSNDPIPPGEGDIFSLPVSVSPNVINKIELEIGEVVLADENAVEIPVDDGKTSVPKVFELSQNYPNPFNPTTTIKFTLPSVGGGEEPLPTTLKIYNVLGELVKTLVDEPKSPGVHYEVWDGQDGQGNQVASGIYFYRLRAGEFCETKKMVLLK